MSVWKIIKPNPSFPHCQCQVHLDPTVKDKTKFLEDDVKYLHHMVVGKYFLKRVFIHRKSIRHEGKCKIFEIIIRIFYSSEDTIKAVKSHKI